MTDQTAAILISAAFFVGVILGAGCVCLGLRIGSRLVGHDAALLRDRAEPELADTAGEEDEDENRGVAI